jgi:hypothetical protein
MIYSWTSIKNPFLWMLYDTSIVSSKKMWAAPVQDLALAQPELRGLDNVRIANPFK